MTAGLELVGARAGYGSVEVLHGVDLRFPAGAVTALVGQNGAGKSTVLRCVAGTVRPRRGRVTWDGVDITRRSPYRFRRSFPRSQNFVLHLFSTVTLLDNAVYKTGLKHE